MQQLIKQTRPLGTSAGVLLPKSWLNKEVVVTLTTPTKETIIKQVIEILSQKNLLEDVKGIYLIGSYARNEQTPESDIDILVITNQTSKLINQNNYEITLIPEPSLRKKIQKNLYLLTSIREAVTLINNSLIEKYKSTHIKMKINPLLKEIKSITEVNKDSIETYKQINKKIPDGIIYSIILRLRELYLTKSLLNKPTSKFKNIINSQIYDAYLRIKRNQKEINNITSEQANNLIKLTEKWLKELKERKKE